MSKIYRVRNLKASPWVGAHRSLGRCPARYWREGVPHTWVRAPFVSTEARFTHYLPNLMWGCNAEESGVRSDAAPHLLTSSGGEHVLSQTAQTPTLSQWVPAARHDMGCSH